MKFSILGLLLLVFLTGCNEEALAGVKQINVNNIPERMEQTIKESNGAIYIDVRETYEYDEAHIAGFVNFPLSTLEEQLNELPKDKDIYVICRSGNRSMQAATLLKEKGFDQVINVQGAMLDWEGETESNN